MSIKDKIYTKLAQRYASESKEDLKEIAYNMALASTSEADIVQANFWDKAERALARIKQQPRKPSPLSEETKKIYASALSVCPICKNKMNLVKLLEDRQVFYCNDHKICQPLPLGE